jgi:hypothetical protein
LKTNRLRIGYKQRLKESTAGENLRSRAILSRD